MMKKRVLNRKSREDADPPARKSEETRSLILETALELLTERGYEETTMRAIAEKAGVALGNTYYYFRSKEHLIQAFYDRLQDRKSTRLNSSHLGISYAVFCLKKKKKKQKRTHEIHKNSNQRDSDD